MIRQAQSGADISHVVRLVGQLTASVNGPQAVSAAHTGAHVARLIQSPAALVLVSDDGFIAAEVFSTIINPEPVAFEHGWFATDRSGLRLLIAFEKWADSMNARKKMSTHAQGGVAARILEKRGYRATELAWFK